MESATGVLISHINEESSLALKLKDWIEPTFPGQCAVFVSSDPKDIPLGAKWLDEITGAMVSARILILICSPASIVRPWINFEAGCGWIKEIPIIPVCHSGQRRSALPPPLSAFQGIELERADFSKDLLEALAHHLKIPKVPPIRYEDMNRELLDAASSIVQPASGGSTPATAAQEAISSEQVQILEFMSKQSSEGRVAEYLALQFKVNPGKMKYHLGVLSERTLVDVVLRVGRSALYSLSQKGRAYLVSKGLL